MNKIDPKKIKLAKEYGKSDIMFRVAQVPNSKKVYFGSSDFNVYHADLEQEKFEPEAIHKHDSYVMGVVLAGKNLVSGSYDGKLIWTDSETKKEIRRVYAHDKWIRNLKVTPDGKKIVSVADDMKCKVWDAATGKLLHTLSGHQEKTPNHYPSMLFAVFDLPRWKKELPRVIKLDMLSSGILILEKNFSL